MPLSESDDTSLSYCDKEALIGLWGGFGDWTWLELDHNGTFKKISKTGETTVGRWLSSNSKPFSPSLMLETNYLLDTSKLRREEFSISCNLDQTSITLSSLENGEQQNFERYKGCNKEQSDLIFPRQAQQWQVLNKQESINLKRSTQIRAVTSSSFGKSNVIGFIQSTVMDVALGTPGGGSYENVGEQVWLKDLFSSSQSFLAVGPIDLIPYDLIGSELRYSIAQGQDTVLLARHSQLDHEHCFYIANLNLQNSNKAKCLKDIGGPVSIQFIGGRYFIAASGFQYEKNGGLFNFFTYFAILNEDGNVEVEKTFEDNWGRTDKLDLLVRNDLNYEVFLWKARFYMFHSKSNDSRFFLSTFDRELNYLGTKDLVYDYLKSSNYSKNMYPLSFEFDSNGFVSTLIMSASPPDARWGLSLMRVDLTSLDFEYNFLDKFSNKRDGFNYLLSKSSNEFVVATESFAGVFGEDLKLREAGVLRYETAPISLVKGEDNLMALWDNEKSISAGIVFVCGD